MSEGVPEPPVIDAPLATPIGDADATPREERARLSGYRRRFAFVYIALALIAGVALGALIVLVSRPDSAPSPVWSAWEPNGSDTARVRQIADHVAKAYRNPEGDQLVVALGGPPTVTAGGETTSPIPIRAIAVRPDTSTGQAEEDDIEIIDATKSMQFVLCGLGDGCSIDGKPSQARHSLLRREALELALYTFKYVDGVDSVTVFLPPPPGGESPATAVFLRRGDVKTGALEAAQANNRTGRAAARRHPGGRAADAQPDHPSAALPVRVHAGPGPLGGAGAGSRRAVTRCPTSVGQLPPDPRLTRAKSRLDRLDWWPRPVRIEGVHLVVAPWLFELPPWKRFDGFATHRVIFLRRADVSDNLIVARALPRLADAAPTGRNAAPLSPDGLRPEPVRAAGTRGGTANRVLTARRECSGAERGAGPPDPVHGGRTAPQVAEPAEGDHTTSSERTRRLAYKGRTNDNRPGRAGCCRCSEPGKVGERLYPSIAARNGAFAASALLTGTSRRSDGRLRAQSRGSACAAARRTRRLPLSSLVSTTPSALSSFTHSAGKCVAARSSSISCQEPSRSTLLIASKVRGGLIPPSLPSDKCRAARDYKTGQNAMQPARNSLAQSRPFRPFPGESRHGGNSAGHGGVSRTQAGTQGGVMRPKRLAVALVGIGLPLILAIHVYERSAHAQPPPEVVVRAQRFELVDANGQLRATLAVGGPSREVVLKLRDAKRNDPRKARWRRERVRSGALQRDVGARGTPARDPHANVRRDPTCQSPRGTPAVAERGRRPPSRRRSTPKESPAGVQLSESQDGRAAPHPDRVLRPLRGEAERRRSGGSTTRRVRGRPRRDRGCTGGGRDLRRAPRRNARVHEIDARSLPRAGRCHPPRPGTAELLAVAANPPSRHGPSCRRPLPTTPSPVSQADTRRVLVNLVERPGPDARIGARLEWREIRVLRSRGTGRNPLSQKFQPTFKGSHHGRNAETVALLVLSDRV